MSKADSFKLTLNLRLKHPESIKIYFHTLELKSTMFSMQDQFTTTALFSLYTGFSFMDLLRATNIFSE